MDDRHQRDLGLDAVAERPKILDHLKRTIERTVLILGRFRAERKDVVDGLRKELLRYDYDPMLLDFEHPANRDVYETVSTLAHLSCFIIVDLTDAQSAPMELQIIVQNLMIPVAPVILDSEPEPDMFDLLRRYVWVLEPFKYQDADHLVDSLGTHVIVPAEEMVRELTKNKRSMIAAIDS